jgi:plasmid stability protein
VDKRDKEGMVKTMEVEEKPIRESITVRKLPDGTKAMLTQLAGIHDRSLEAETRHAIKQYVASNANERLAIESGGNQRDYPTENAERHVYLVTAKLESVKRKLDGGSKAVSINDLERLEEELKQARLELGEVCKGHPLALLHAMQPL